MVRICVVGSTNMDLIFRVPRLPQPGETLTGRDFQTGCGGKGANQAVMAARLGASVAMVSCIGADIFGDKALANFRAAGIDVTHVLRDPVAPTGVAAIAVDDDAQNCIVVIPGANARLSPSHVHESVAAVQNAKIMLAQLEVPVDSVREALLLARGHGVCTLLNPVPALPLADDLLGLVDICVLNETELEIVSGTSGVSIQEMISAAWELLKRGPKRIIITLGKDGALVIDAERAEHIPGVPVTAVDSAGAGDAFIGSLAVALAEGSDLHAAVLRANAVAALSVTRSGTQTSFPSAEEVANFLKERGTVEE